MNHNEFDRTNDQDQLLDDLAAYAMGVLEPAEARVIEAQLAVSPQLQARLRTISSTVDQLAYSAPQLPPPPHVKARLLARVESDQQRQAAPRQSRRAFGATAPRQPRRSVAQPVDQWAQRQAEAWLALANRWKFATFATAAVLLLFVVLTYSMQRQLTAIRGTLTAMQTELSALQQTNSELEQINILLREQGEEQQAQLVKLASANQIVTLASNTEGITGRGMLFVGDNSLTLMVHGLAPLPDEQTYELWLIPAEGEAVASGLVPVIQNESPSVISGLPRNAQEFAAVGLSIEPAGGSPTGKPTGAVVLLGTRTETS